MLICIRRYINWKLKRIALITKQNQIIHIQMFHMLLSIKLSSLGRIVVLNIFPSIPKSLKKKPKESYKKNKDK